MEQPRRRVYGADHDDPHPYAQPDRTYAELVGGPLDGLLVDVTASTPEEIADGAALITEHGIHGPGGRAWYSPRDTVTRWHWDGDTP